MIICCLLAVRGRFGAAGGCGQRTVVRSIKSQGAACSKKPLKRHKWVNRDAKTVRFGAIFTGFRLNAHLSEAILKLTQLVHLFC
jgi:hypothetical protein